MHSLEHSFINTNAKDPAKKYRKCVRRHFNPEPRKHFNPEPRKHFNPEPRKLTTKRRTLSNAYMLWDANYSNAASCKSHLTRKRKVNFREENNKVHPIPPRPLKRGKIRTAHFESTWNEQKKEAVDTKIREFFQGVDSGRRGDAMREINESRGRAKLRSIRKLKITSIYFDDRKDVQALFCTLEYPKSKHVDIVRMYNMPDPWLKKVIEYYHEQGADCVDDLYDINSGYFKPKVILEHTFIDAEYEDEFQELSDVLHTKKYWVQSSDILFLKVKWYGSEEQTWEKYSDISHLEIAQNYLYNNGLIYL
jgi:hypothetical protein